MSIFCSLQTATLCPVVLLFLPCFWGWFACGRKECLLWDHGAYNHSAYNHSAYRHSAYNHSAYNQLSSIFWCHNVFVEFIHFYTYVEISFVIAWHTISVSFYGTKTFMKHIITLSESFIWVIHFQHFLILLSFLVGILKLKVLWQLHAVHSENKKKKSVLCSKNWCLIQDLSVKHKHNFYFVFFRVCLWQTCHWIMYHRKH